MSELALYKQKRINENNSIYNKTITQLYLTLLINITNVNKSPYNIRTKKSLISSLTNTYTINVNNLTVNLNKSNTIIRNFVPKTHLINRNKKALLIGINYVGTHNELYGCINDALALKDRISTKGFTNITIITD